MPRKKNARETCGNFGDQGSGIKKQGSGIKEQGSGVRNQRAEIGDRGSGEPQNFEQGMSNIEVMETSMNYRFFTARSAKED